jgi:hypothetical protein
VPASRLRSIGISLIEPRRPQQEPVKASPSQVASAKPEAGFAASAEDVSEGMAQVSTKRLEG